MYLNNCVLNSNGKEYILTGPCVITGKDFSIHLKEEQIRDVMDWVNGKYMQDAMPYLSAGQREFLISGTSPEGWIQIFGEEDED
jgi:hypothetical protein